jgi:flotillin
LLRIQVEASKNIKIDKVTVWDSAAGGKTPATANFLAGMAKSIPPLQDLFAMAGMSLPEYLGKEKEAPADAEAPADPAR